MLFPYFRTICVYRLFMGTLPKPQPGCAKGEGENGSCLVVICKLPWQGYPHPLPPLPSPPPPGSWWHPKYTYTKNYIELHCITQWRLLQQQTKYPYLSLYLMVRNSEIILDIYWTRLKLVLYCRQSKAWAMLAAFFFVSAVCTGYSRYLRVTASKI